MTENENLFQDDDFMFGDESEDNTPQEQVVSSETWKIMIVDDEADVHRMTERILEDITFDGKGFTYLNAYSGKEAIELFEAHPDTALILLDVVMRTENDGLKVVEFIRNELKNKFVRIILRTGQPGQAPERTVITDYDIHDYKLKSMLTDQALYTAVISALRTYRDLRIIEEKHNELEWALADAQAAQKARYQILANMNHEIKTPLQGILGFTEIILISETNNDNREYLSHIKESAEGLHKVLTNVLELTELVGNDWDLNECTIQVRDFINIIMDTIQIQAEWKSIMVGCDIDKSIPEMIIVDPKRLKQIIMNLLINAVRYTDDGTVSLTIQLQSEKQLHFIIKDTGAGIPEENQAQIFDPFMLGEDFLTKKHSGVGVGLSICKTIVQRMNGNIWFESQPGEGSTFYFTIPFQT
ncbi:MAG: histidine kinase [Candidatus Magnetoglobus multicellularis str. Araruama]|uniref:histidine kinase n=1 Tax=Candidatus Magnetoglobus multicellularis str. Araruama TaxID=890399 RepID=A0A1V1PBT0_9BACT|nr:MAG: histidine kinase [Candidatus Magnetoglobus multicellularis str. Araruama]